MGFTRLRYLTNDPKKITVDLTILKNPFIRIENPRKYFQLKNGVLKSLTLNAKSLNDEPRNKDQDTTKIFYHINGKLGKDQITSTSTRDHRAKISKDQMPNLIKILKRIKKVGVATYFFKKK